MALSELDKIVALFEEGREEHVLNTFQGLDVLIDTGYVDSVGQSSLGRAERLHAVARAAQERVDISSQEAFGRLLDLMAQCRCHFEVREHYGTCTDGAELTVDMSLTLDELIEVRRRVAELNAARGSFVDG